MIKALTVAAAVLFITTSANAYTYCPLDQTYRVTCPTQTEAPASTSTRAYSDSTIVGGRPKGCPWRYCGCGVSLKVFNRIIPELNLAANWLRKFPRATCAAGRVAARSGHVFYIESCNGDGTVLAYDPNSGGGKTRVHTISLRGYHIVDPTSHAGL